jgi:hypothetical protein
MSRPLVFATAVALGLGLLVRLLPVLEAPLTTGDGGLIVVMVDDIRAAGLALPTVTTYNHTNLPFVYPPLGLYAGAGLGELAGLSSLDVVRLLALGVSLATLGVFGLLAFRALAPLAAAGALATYALMPHAYDGIVSGGGLTRGMGLLFALLALFVAASPPGLSRRSAVFMGALVGLSALSHPQAAVMAAAGSAVFAYRHRPASNIGLLLIAAGVAALVVSPWLVAIAGEHGWTAVLAARHRWEPLVSVIRLLSLNFSGGAFTDLFLLFGVLGLASDLSRRVPRLTAFLGCVVLAGEGGGSFLAALPWALLAGVGVQFVVERFGPRRRATDRLLGVALGASALFLTLISSLGAVVSETSRLQFVSADQVEGMVWVADNSDPETRFIVATTVVWGFDEISEWFPAVADRQSVATVQGSEWLGPEAFTDQVDIHSDVLICTRSTARCMAEWAAGAGFGDAWLFIPKGQVNGPLSPRDCCRALRETVQQSGLYDVVYDGVGATIARPVNEED